MKSQPDPANAVNRPFQWDGNLESLPGMLLDSAPFMIWVKDIAGRYVFINEAYRQFFRFPARCGLDSPICRFIRPTSRYVTAAKTNKPARKTNR